MMEVHAMEQGSEEWLAARRGIPTGSAMKALFTASHGLPKANSKQLISYAAELAADSFSGLPLSNEESFQGNWATARGHDLEPIARKEYNFSQDLEVIETGFVTDYGCGCSPDALVGDVGALEIKCLLSKAHTICVTEAIGGTVPADYYVQCQAESWICGREWTDLYFYHPHLPSYCIRVMASAEFQEKLVTQTRAVIAQRDLMMKALGKADDT